MKRREFLKESARGLVALSASRLLPGLPLIAETTAGHAENAMPNTNWADPALGATASASSYCDDPPWGYSPENVLGDNFNIGWQTDTGVFGAWIEIGFP